MSEEHPRGADAAVELPDELPATIKRSNGVDRLDVLQASLNERNAAANDALNGLAPNAVPNKSDQPESPGRNAATNGNLDENDRELEALALSSSITELDYAVQNMFSLLFQVQELRHASADADSTRNASDEPLPDDVDIALAKLDEHLDATSREVSTLQDRMDSFLQAGQSDFVSDKWTELLSSWRKAQMEAESIRRELLEDKYLIVYRTVSKQADDMMASLEKILAQCSTFVQEVHGCYYTTSEEALSGYPSEKLQDHLSSFIALHKSYHQKTKYYVPSCEHVLKTIDSGIAQQQSLNGEILRGHSDMKLRWRNLQERMTRTDREMQSAQELLSNASAKAQIGHSKSQSIASSSSSDVTKSSSKGSLSTPSRGIMQRGKSKDHLTPSPKTSKQESPSSSRAVSPFRRIADRLKSSRNGKDASPPPVPPLPASAEVSRPQSRMSNGSAALSRPPAQAGRPSIVQSHKYTQSSQLSSPAMSNRPSYMTSSTLSERAPSPLPGTNQDRPRWNASTKPIRDDLSSSSSATRNAPRQSALYDTPTRSTTPAARMQDGRLTPSMYARPASRNFTAPIPSFAARPSSPALSATSNTSGTHRLRPSSPNSRIPAPGTSPQKGRQSLGGTMRKPRMSAPALEDNSLETLFFRSGSPGDGQSSSLMQRALSPTLSAGGQTAVSSIGGTWRQSHIPRLSLSVSSQSNTPLASPRASAVFTPEPMLQSRAARASAIYGGRSGRTSLGLPGMPNDYFAGQGRQRTVRTSSNSDATGGRRSSMLATSPVRYLEEDAAAGPYQPNMIDPLDTELASIVNSQPFFIFCKAVDPPLSKAAAAAQAPGERMAKYIFGNSDKPVSCKLVERGAGKGRKVLCRVGGVWQDLSIHLLNQQALY